MTDQTTEMVETKIMIDASEPKRIINVFISSPGDVLIERRRAILVCNRLNREFCGFFNVHSVLWEDEPMIAAGHFQDVIEPAPSEADIVAVILTIKNSHIVTIY